MTDTFNRHSGQVVLPAGHPRINPGRNSVGHVAQTVQQKSARYALQMQANAELLALKAQAAAYIGQRVLDAAVVITLVEQRCLQVAPEGAHRYSFLADTATALLGDVLLDASRHLEIR